MVRKSLNDTLMDIAWKWAERGTCPRLKVGAVIADPSGHIISSGYNGAVSGKPHCEDEGCILDGDHCIRAVHAEQNAIVFAARRGVSVEGASIHCTHKPCDRCMNMITQAGILRVFFGTTYKSNLLA